MCLFDVPLLLLLFPSALVLQGGSPLAASCIATATVQLIPIVVVLAAFIDASLSLPPPPPLRALVVAALLVPRHIIAIAAMRGAVPPPPKECAMWAWAMGKEGSNAWPHAQL